ncbi:MAG: N-acetyl-1-D-myo-inositol-2-amino-2-deoxy-alpha-D-glucopyranoside deacetylase, partial [Mycobacteriaceae bacterium]|nr:N-acetyl-1-D-myo-inositol-2-amino-2-deoxy-alpha-D-glucopyranoside deacetylase [Mycobacteriaceae bacterium]
STPAAAGMDARNGCENTWFLGGAGRWRDSGMAGAASQAHPRAFVNADPGEAVGALVEVIAEIRPQVVVTYDPQGGYGHPDHIQAHRITTAAVEAAAATGRWDVSKVYWTVLDRAAFARGLGELGPVPPGWSVQPEVSEWMTVEPERVTAEVDVAATLDAKRAALGAHATQVAVAPDGRCYALSNNVATPLLDREHYILVRGAPGSLGPDGREHDLFGGVA